MRPEGRFSIRLLVSTAIALWVFVLFYIASFGITVPSRDVAQSDLAHRNSVHEALVEKLEQTIADIDKLREQNAELRKLADQQKSLIWRTQSELKQRKDAAPDVVKLVETGDQKENLYTKDHEVMRRQLDDGIRELYFYLLDQSENKEINLGKVGKHALDQMFSLLATSLNFSYVDGSQEWRERSLAKLTNKIQGAIERKQNPTDCSKAKVLTCNLNKGCGFGCQLHHVAYCFVVAFGTNRTLILQEDGKEWRYSDKGWSSVFQPVTKCSYREAVGGERAAQWESEESNSKDRVVFLPIVDGLGGGGRICRSRFLGNSPTRCSSSMPTRPSSSFLSLSGTLCEVRTTLRRPLLNHQRRFHLKKSGGRWGSAKCAEGEALSCRRGTWIEAWRRGPRG
ncbi:hypothetical protein L596_027619 [Steinernema carpocapsae]|nr:hypothetical protein L596_027619 [Steinernema carpocapsae]